MREAAELALQGAPLQGPFILIGVRAVAFACRVLWAFLLSPAMAWAETGVSFDLSGQEGPQRCQLLLVHLRLDAAPKVFLNGKPVSTAVETKGDWTRHLLDTECRPGTHRIALNDSTVPFLVAGKVGRALISRPYVPVGFSPLGACVAIADMRGQRALASNEADLRAALRLTKDFGPVAIGLLTGSSIGDLSKWKEVLAKFGLGTLGIAELDQHSYTVVERLNGWFTAWEQEHCAQVHGGVGKR